MRAQRREKPAAGSRCLVLVLLLCLLLCLPACKNSGGLLSRMDESANPPAPANLTVRTSMDVRTTDKVSDATTVNVTISDLHGLTGSLRERLENRLQERGFTLSPQPSKADRIVTLIILYRGAGALAGMEQCVQAGYGSPVPAMNEDGAVLLADLLIASRRVPNGNAHLRNVGARNTLSSSQIRLGFHSTDGRALRNRSLEEALAGEIAGIAASGEFDTKHTPSALTPVRPEPKKTQKTQKTPAKSTKSSAQKSTKTKAKK